MSLPEFSREQQQTMLDIARHSIHFYLENQVVLPIQVQDFDVELQQQLSCFVTLKINGELRGCIGHLEPRQPLIEDVAENAVAAATQDYRFNQVTLNELASIELSISVIGQSQHIYAKSEAELLAQLKPGIDGLILSYQNQRATFLPSVWDSLSEPGAFIRQLKLKAGLEPDFWHTNLRAEKYQTVTIFETTPA